MELNWIFDCFGDPPCWHTMVGTDGMAITCNVEGFHVEYMSHETTEVVPVDTCLTLTDAKASAEDHLAEILLTKTG